MFRVWENIRKTKGIINQFLVGDYCGRIYIHLNNRVIITKHVWKALGLTGGSYVGDKVQGR